MRLLSSNNFIDLPAILVLYIAIRHAEHSLLFFLAEQGDSVAEQLQRLVVDVGDAGAHVPQQSLVVLGRGQGSTIDEAVDEVEVVHEVALGVDWLAAEELPQEFVGEGELGRVRSLEHHADDSSQQEVLRLFALVLIKVHNMQLQVKMFAVVGVLRSHVFGVGVHRSGVEVELYRLELHARDIVFEDVRR